MRKLCMYYIVYYWPHLIFVMLLSTFELKIDETYCILLTQYGKSHSSHLSHFNIRCYLHLDESHLEPMLNMWNYESDVKPTLNMWNYERNSERHQICWPSIHSWINTQVCCATVTMFTKLTSIHHWCIHAILKVITIWVFCLNPRRQERSAKDETDVSRVACGGDKQHAVSTLNREKLCPRWIVLLHALFIPHQCPGVPQRNAWRQIGN